MLGTCSLRATAIETFESFEKKGKQCAVLFDFEDLADLENQEDCYFFSQNLLNHDGFINIIYVLASLQDRVDLGTFCHLVNCIFKNEELPRNRFII